MKQKTIGQRILESVLTNGSKIWILETDESRLS